MIKIKLSNWERLWLTLMIGSGSGNIAQIRLGYKALDILEFSDKEREIVGFKQIGIRQRQWGWQQEHEWELELPSDIWQLIVTRAKTFQAWPQDPRTDVLYNKILEENQ